MRPVTNPAWLLATALLSAAPLAGCGPQAEQGATVTGKVVKDAQPLSVPGMEIGAGTIEAVLIRVGDGRKEYELLQADGRFRFTGQEQGIASGSYKLAIYQRSDGPESDDLQGMFSEENTPITLKVPEKVGPKHDLGTIELSEY